MAQGNVHWSANFDEIQDFENDMRNGFGGLGFLDDGDFAATSDPLGPVKAGLDPDLDALAAYVASLGQETIPRSPFRSTDGSFTAEALAGRSLFNSLGCNTCHQGADFTDSTLGTANLMLVLVGYLLLAALLVFVLGRQRVVRVVVPVVEAPVPAMGVDLETDETRSRQRLRGGLSIARVLGFRRCKRSLRLLRAVPGRRHRPGSAP